MVVQTAIDEPLRTGTTALRAFTRAFTADAITPISAYLALAPPGRSCLLGDVRAADGIPA